VAAPTFSDKHQPEYRLLLRTLLHGFRACLVALKKCDAPTTDGTVIFRVFEGSVRSMSLFDTDQRDITEAMDWFAAVLIEVNLHVFQEVWTHKIEFFFEHANKRPTLLHICQSLFAKETSSPTLVATILRFLIDRLPLLGEYDDQTAVVTIRLYKMAFNAVQTFPQANEPILASHLAKLIMDCFPLAAKATKPTNYLHLLRGLFRAIGGGGGRFELLYQEVLPLLPEMLESLNRQLLASEGYTRDMIVELCLTVPLRLTHLLPHLTYLMHPLALALRGNPELVSQGLRTLELCIDNLTPDFLDPTLSTVLRELMEALHSHLKPLPANHHHAHTTIRILGKLGGRNRRLLTKEPSLQYRHYSPPTTAQISSGSSVSKIDLGPVSILASRTIKKASSPYRGPAYQYLVTCLNVLVHEVKSMYVCVTFTPLILKCVGYRRSQPRKCLRQSTGRCV
jgi:transformation/transcription domain-associated protein